MTINIGDKLPNATVFEFFHEETEGCSLGPNKFEVEKELAGKTVAILALPGAYTPTCSAKHVPGFIANYDAFKAKGVDEIWCISVNDAFVMFQWAQHLSIRNLQLQLAGHLTVERFQQGIEPGGVVAVTGGGIGSGDGAGIDVADSGCGGGRTACARPSAGC